MKPAEAWIEQVQQRLAGPRFGLHHPARIAHGADPLPARPVERPGRRQHMRPKLAQLAQHFVDGRRVPKSGTEREIPADLVLIAMGFTGPERQLLEEQLGAQFTGRGNVHRENDYQTTAPGVFVAGDAGRGQSLIVWAIAEGRAAAASVDAYLMGETQLPAPVRPTDVAIGLQSA